MPPTVECPSPQRLQDFLRGRLVEADRALLETHLAACPACREALRSLSDTGVLCEGQDPHRDLDEPPNHEAAAAESERLGAPRNHPGQAVTLDGAWVPSAQTFGEARETGEEDVRALLTPPQQADELGRLGPYRVLRVLGQGGMGVVFEAEDRTGRRFALKVMRPALAAVPSSRERFLREARAAAHIHHPNVVTVYHVGEERGIPYLALELLHGEPLNERLRRSGPLPLADVLRIGAATARGLAAAHAHGLVHRDIKPANLFLETVPESGAAAPYQVKILDFGLARAGGGETQLTQTGVIVGTPAFMAPEQAAGAAVDPRADLFSLGCVLYAVATGQQPFTARDVIATLTAVATRDPVPPVQLNPAVPVGLSNLILHLLQKDPARRPPSAEEVAAVLDLLAAGAAPPAGPRGRQALLGLAVALLLAVPAALLLRRGTPEGARVTAPAAPRRPVPPRPIGLDVFRREQLSPAARALYGLGDPARAPAELVGILGDARFRLAGGRGSRPGARTALHRRRAAPHELPPP